MSPHDRRLSQPYVLVRRCGTAPPHVTCTQIEGQIRVSPCYCRFLLQHPSPRITAIDVVDRFGVRISCEPKVKPPAQEVVDRTDREASDEESGSSRSDIGSSFDYLQIIGQRNSGNKLEVLLEWTPSWVSVDNLDNAKTRALLKKTVSVKCRSIT